MAICPNDFYQTAKEMSNGEREVDFRNAISRAYYSMFITCRDTVGTIIKADGDGGIHSAYINYFINRTSKTEDDKTHKKIGFKLKQARDLRVRADYFIDNDCTKADAEQAILHADSINKLLLELPIEKTA